ncbi:GNAT family N-acetyltransferase [Nissabacter sp. SGAir0207]|uniref:GNAT family N-acetyltransferase n=1 Tax=Nissabacter sp. SGAir0207 TaxID=2126321 RepID=UPI0010CCD1D4|nr:GNAT family N-acetyltransferase [Nissabacter sp. SGAir0207]QCR38388.1 GNAT family N-acetyltransferase [Nissabacter sp. SGAir0207]
MSEPCFIETRPDDPRVATLMAALSRECRARYGLASGDRNPVPLSRFQVPEGGFILQLLDGEPVAMGAYTRYDQDTAELDYVWTRADQRRQGLALRMVAELERRAREEGYKQAIITTGCRQPEAISLCLSLGYTPLFDVHADPARYAEPPYDGHLSFVKWLVALTAVRRRVLKAS